MRLNATNFRQLAIIALWSGFANFASIVSGQQPSSPATISIGDLNAAAEELRSFKPADQFAEVPRGPDVSGKRFSYEVHPRNWAPGGVNSCGGFPEWQYAHGAVFISALQYSIGLSGFSITKSTLVTNNAKLKSAAEIQINSFSCSVSDPSTYVAGNAYGAKFEVRKTTDRLNGIADIAPYDFKFVRTWEGAMTGDEARRLTPNLTVRVSGNLQAWPDGSAVVCGIEERDPTVNLPYNKIVDACLFKGTVDTLEFLDGSTGQVYYRAVRKLK